MGHDTLGRQTSATDFLGYSRGQQYNAIYQPTQATNALQQKTTQSYDSSGRLLAVTNTAGVGIETYTYHAQGRLTKTTDALGQATNTEMLRRHKEKSHLPQRRRGRRDPQRKSILSFSDLLLLRTLRLCGEGFLSCAASVNNPALKLHHARLQQPQPTVGAGCGRF